MLARCATYVPDGITARRAIVECDIRTGLSSFSIVGLGDVVARELRERVRAAIINSGYDFPTQRVTINIGPASLRAASPGVSLAVALAVLAASGQMPAQRIAAIAVYGELALDGSIRAVPGTLAAGAAHRSGGGSAPFLYSGKPLPYGIAPNPSIPVGHLTDFAYLDLDRHHDVVTLRTAPAQQPDFADIRGHQAAIYALTVAAAGGLHVLLRGAPGAGATMIARRLLGILPDLTETEQHEVAVIRDAAGLGHDSARPFRAPHHTISAAGLVGGGAPIRPGEITLAHRGVLHLSDLADFQRQTLEALREPLTSGEVTLVRGQRAYRFPASFQLVASVTPCPCGYLGTERCACDAYALARYHRRVNASLLDRISIIVDLPAQVDDMQASTVTSAALRDQVTSAHQRRIEREATARRNDFEADTIALRSLSSTGETALNDAYRAGLLSARGRGMILHLAQTVADLAGEDTITGDTVRTALGLRGNLLTAPLPA